MPVANTSDGESLKLPTIMAAPSQGLNTERKKLQHTTAATTTITTNIPKLLTSRTQVTHSAKDLCQDPSLVSAKDARNIVSHPSARRPPNARVVLPTDLPQASEVGRQQSSNYTEGVMGTITSFIPAGGLPPPKDEHQILKDDLRRVQNELENCKRELRRCHGEIHGANQYMQELHHEKQRWKDHMGGMQHELTSVYQQLEDAKTLSEVRGKELFGARVFLTKADTLSISEVGEKVTALNEEIFRAAATLGEGLTRQRHDLSQEELDTAAAESQEMVGEKISSLLISQAQKSEPNLNPLLVQVVLQIFIVNYCVSKIRSWYPSDSAIAGFLDAIYSEIRLTEEQSVAGRWRALTHAHTRPSTETWTNELYKKLMSVFKIAAWVPGSLEKQEFLRQRLPPIFKAVKDIRIAIGEKVTSADLDVSVIHCGMTYQPSFMEDACGDSKQQPSGERTPDIVVGTTGIGLKKVMVERGANSAPRFQNVISAKVVLESTFKVLEPVQPMGRLRRKKKFESTDRTNQDGRVDQVPAADSLQDELNNVHEQLEGVKTVSEGHEKESSGARASWTKADVLSISEVGQKVAALNEEIFQAAATLGEGLTHQRHDLSQGELDAAAAESKEMIGEKISSLLISQSQKPEPETNPLLVQVVLQIFMVKFCVSKIQSWYPGDSTIAGSLNTIYSRIRLTEEQSVAGRWRALTRAHTRPTTEAWTLELLKKLLSVLKIAAWMLISPESQESFIRHLPAIFKAVNELRIAIGENFTSADLDISVFDCDMVYQPSVMEDVYGDASCHRTSETVAGTTGIGLMKLMTERSAMDTLQFQSVISAKIVLESTLKEALEPVRSSDTPRQTKKPAKNTDGVDQDGRD